MLDSRWNQNGTKVQSQRFLIHLRPLHDLLPCRLLNMEQGPFSTAQSALVLVGWRWPQKYEPQLITCRRRRVPPGLPGGVGVVDGIHHHGLPE